MCVCVCMCVFLTACPHLVCAGPVAQLHSLSRTGQRVEQFQARTQYTGLVFVWTLIMSCDPHSLYTLEAHLTELTNHTRHNALVNLQTHTHTHTHIHAYIALRTLCSCLCLQAPRPSWLKHTNTHTHTCTHTHTHTHTQARQSQRAAACCSRRG